MTDKQLALYMAFCVVWGIYCGNTFTRIWKVVGMCAIGVFIAHQLIIYFIS